MKNTSATTLVDLGFKAVADHKERGFRINRRGFKTLLAVLFWLVSTLHVSAQKATVLEAFSRHGIDVNILDPNCIQQPDDFAYNLRQATIAGGKETVIDAKFDPSGAKDEQWTVISVNGKSPSKSDINSFRKSQAKPAESSQADDASYRIEKESADYLVVSYKPNAASIPKDAPFMKDCRSYMTINLKNKSLEQVQVLNEKPVKIKMLNADKFEVVTKYNRNEQAKRYFASNQNLVIQARFLGQAVNVQTTTEYSGYSKK
ncbi:hypothetical protein AAFN85_08895 [Mucilaginibacter sp. CAU 1740]|uniref:hypothetical protein n=1 Tax=Mucilaginibacter sp. CAU 1740 TaxID=3140365 RepID=UPI00325BFAC8